MSVAKNYIYFLAFQLLSIIVPIITIPYITKVLGVEGVGINAFTSSIVQYFMLIASLGVGIYGSRQIAYTRDNEENINKNFWEIFTIKLFMTSISLVIFLLWVYLSEVKYKEILFIEGLYLVSTAIDISWFFAGLEDFKKTVFKNALVKVLSVISIFIFVRQSEDLWRYVLILAAGEVLGQLTLWIYKPSYIIFPDFKEFKVLRHFKPLMSLFVSQVAIQIYTAIDRTMLGIMSTQTEVGLYDVSQRIIKLSLTIVTTMGTVILPRASYMYAKNDNEHIPEFITQNFLFVTYLSIPMLFGFLGITDNLVGWFLGREFLDTVWLIEISTPMLLFCSWSSILGTYLISTDRQNKATISFIAGAFINIIINILLIPKYEAVGACIAAIFAEFLGFIIQLYYCRFVLKFKIIFLGIIKYIFSSIIMLGIINLVQLILGYGWYVTFIQIVIGFICYGAILFIIKDEINRIIMNKILSIKIWKRKSN